MKFDISILDEIKPVEKIYDNNCIPIAFASSDYFVPYLAVTIQSIIEHSNALYNYDLVVFNKDISNNNQMKLAKMLNNYDNFHIRFVNVSNIFSQLSLYTPGHVSIETYFRLIIPLYMQSYNKILFLDSDLCILEDVANLYNIDIGDNALAATEECLMSALVGIHGQWVVDYMHDRLGLKNIDKYFQAGVMIMNIKKFIENKYSYTLLKMVEEFNYNIVDQDAMNELLNDEVYWLPNEWNYPPLQKHMKDVNYLDNMSDYIRKKYLAVKNPKLLHFADREKPWFYPDEDYAEVWWQYARKSPFYEIIMARMIDNKLAVSNKQLSSTLKNNLLKYFQNTMYNMGHYPKNVFNYYKYRVLRNFVFGKTLKRYIYKKNLYKAKIKTVDHFINGK